MSSSERSGLPPELQSRLQQESSAERAGLEYTWRLLDTGQHPKDDLPDADETWAVVQQRLADHSDASPSDRRPVARRTKRSRRWQGWKTTAAVVIVAVAAILLAFRRPVSVSAPAGAQRVVSLPDGSTVELNSGTTLSYRRGFDGWPFLSAQRRAVQLRGEAFFEVVEDERPFVVETFNAHVRVVGTQFNVRAWPDAASRETRVTLTSGRVRVAAAARASTAVMLATPGHSSRVRASATAPTPPQPASVERTLAWRRQGFAASNQALPALFAKLERRFGARITLQAPSARMDSMTLFYPQKVDLETILRDICTAQGLAFRRTSQGYLVFQGR